MEQAERKLVRSLSVRIPEDLAQRIEQEAARQLRSMNAQIQFILEQAHPASLIEFPADVPMIGKRGKDGNHV